MQSTEEPPLRSRTAEAAFAAFFRAHYGRVLAYAVRRVADHESAREIAADVFRIAWASYRPDAEPSVTWLLTVARNRLGDAYRRSARELRLRRVLEADLSVAGAAVEADPRVEETLQRLSPAMREVLVLTYWDGLAAAEIAELLGVSAPAVRVRVHRARRAFAAAWAEEER